MSKAKSKKPKRGRPLLPAADKRQRVHLRLLQADIDAADAIGEGVISRGIELALRAYTHASQQADAYDAAHGPTREDYAELDGAERGESA